MLSVPIASNSCVQLPPPSVDFQTPPAARAKEEVRFVGRVDRESGHAADHAAHVPVEHVHGRRGRAAASFGSRAARGAWVAICRFSVLNRSGATRARIGLLVESTRLFEPFEAAFDRLVLELGFVTGGEHERTVWQPMRTR